MKSMRKTTCILLALIMITAMATTVFAEGTTNKITINGAKTGETYSAYKMLDLSVDVANSAYSYTVNSAWTAFFADTETAAWKTVFQKDSQGYVTAKDGIEDETAWNATSNLSKFAEAAAAFAKGLTATASETASDESVELTTSEPGYYLVTSTLGTRAMIDTTPGDVTMTEKNAVSSIEKTVKEDSNSTYGTSNDAQIGDTVEFMSTATIVPRSVGNKIHDTMSSGLTFDTNSIKIYTNEALTTELATGYYTIQGTPDNGDTFTIVIKDTFAATATAEQKLYITYTATLNEKAAVTTTGEGEAATTTPAITDQTNITHISTGNATISQTATTTTTTQVQRLQACKGLSKQSGRCGLFLEEG